MFRTILFLSITLVAAQDFTSVYDSLCPCDLTVNSCDVNCCCDLYCSANDRLVFSECINYDQNRGSKSCFPPSTIVFNSTFYPTGFDDGLLCIYYDNNKNRNYYAQPSIVDSVDLFNEYVAAYSTESYQSEPFLGNDLASFTSYYQVGQPIYSVDGENLLSHFVVPQPLLTDYCNYNTPAGFLRPINVTCSHPARNLSTECTSAWHMNGQNYGNFQLLGSPTPLAAATGNASTAGNPSASFIIQDSDKITIIPSTAALIQQLQSMATSGNENVTISPTSGPTQLSPPPAPSWDARTRTCLNVPLKVNYVIILGDAGRIVGAAADITVGSVSSLEPAFSRRFSTSFRWVNDSTDTFRRSGNPGYIVGLPVMAGQVLQQNNSEVVLLSKDNAQWLTLMTPTGQGSCTSQNRVPILFGENTQTGCLIEISSQTTADACIRIRTDVLNGLRGPTRNRIATYGNVSVERTADWVPILVENDPILESSTTAASPRGSCLDMILGVHYEILYAFTGSASNPQAKIIGAKMTFLPSRPISIQCIGPFCSSSVSNLTQKIPVISSVTFIDVSRPPEAVQAQIPTFNARLPYDFFYPFAGASSVINPITSLITCLSLLICNL